MEPDEICDIGVRIEPCNRIPNGIKGYDICEQIKKMNKHDLELLYMDQDPSIYTNCGINSVCFDSLLRLYSNNHSYYIKKADIKSLLNLESWFIQVIEPPPLHDKSEMEGWIVREKAKLEGCTYYCKFKDKRKMRLSREVMNQVRLNYKNLRQWRV